MKFTILFFCLFLGSLFTKGQSIDTYLVSSGGSIYSNEDVNLQWTIGELAVKNYNETSVLLSEGFQQVYAPTIVHVEDFHVSLGIHLYPVPLKDILTIEFEKNNTYTLNIYNIVGEHILTKIDVLSHTTIDLSNLAEGTYLLKFTNKKGQTNTHKIIKI